MEKTNNDYVEDSVMKKETHTVSKHKKKYCKYQLVRNSIGMIIVCNHFPLGCVRYNTIHHPPSTIHIV